VVFAHGVWQDVAKLEGDMSGSDGGRAAFPEERFRFVFEQAADGMFIASPDGVYLAVNPSGSRLLAYDEGELVGKHLTDLVRPEDLGRLAMALNELRGNRSQTRTWWLRRKDGSLVEVELNAQRLEDGSLLGIVRDLTARRTLEEHARTSQDRLRSILETAPDTIMAVDRSGKILFINRTVPPLTPARVVGTICYDYVPPDSRPRVEAALERVFTTRVLDEYEIQGPPGTEAEQEWVSVRAGPLVENDGVVAAILCATNVTARRRNEERIRELVSRLQKIASQVPGMVFQFRQQPDGKVCFPYVSDRIRDILRLSPEDVRQDASAAFALLHPDDRPAVIDTLTDSARTLTPVQGEARVVFPDGEERWLYGNAMPEQQPDSSTLWHGFAHDITLRKQAELQQAALEEQLRQSQKVESIGKLAGGIAHDFNNLLTSVMGFVHLALLEMEPESTAAGYLAGIQDSAERGAAMTQQLLAFARRRIVRPEIVDLNEVLRRMTALLTRLVGENLELVLSPAPKVGRVKVDIGGLEQVIMNLVVNARDAIKDTGRITLETRDVTLDEAFSRTQAELLPGEYVMLAVIDTGTGMSPDVKARIFEPFFTTKPVGKGTGLGLSMCYGIVKQAGGHMTVDSEPGTGSTLRVFLPRAADERATSTDRPPESIGKRGHETILIVEDEVLILRVASAALSALGYDVLTATNALDAIALVEHRKDPVHLLVTDVVMPKMGGPDLAKHLVALRPDLKVLFSSGYTENAIVDRGVLDERVHFLQKPYTPSTLARRVREILDE
jgi:PAS domain S-box-containing protein